LGAFFGIETMLKKIGLIAILTVILGLSVRVHAEAPDPTILSDVPPLESIAQVPNQKPDPAILEDVAALKQKLGAGWKVALNNEGTQIISAVKELEETVESPMANQEFLTDTARAKMWDKVEKTATDFLKENARFFQLHSNLSDLGKPSVDFPGMTRDYKVAYTQIYRGLAVYDSSSHYGTGIRVGVEPTGEITSVYSGYVPNLKNISTSPRLSKSDVIAVANKNAVENKTKIENELIRSTDGNAEAIEKLKKNEKKFMKKPDPDLIIYAGGERPILAYKFDLGGFVHKTFVIDANNGEINNTLSFPNAVDWTSNMVAFD
jgi:hypothetical protein